MAVISVARLALLEWLYTKTRDRLPRDARVFQIVFLAALLTTGVLLRDFSVQPLQIALAFAAGLATQAFWLKRLGLQQKGFLSAIVTCCGLSLPTARVMPPLPMPTAARAASSIQASSCVLSQLACACSAATRCSTPAGFCPLPLASSIRVAIAARSRSSEP